MKRKLRGSMTVEASVIVPLILGMVMCLFFILFYYHDKNVVSAVAHETVVYACKADEISIEETENYFQKRIQEKLLLFPRVHTEIAVEQDVIHLKGIARKRGMTLKVEAQMKRTEPEKYIRNIRRIGALN